MLPITMLRHMFTSPLNMYLQGPRPPEGRDEGDAEPHRDVARDLRRLGGRGLHLEAAARHRRLHDVRPLHQRVPGPRHRQAARPARDRAEDRRGDGRHRRRTVTSAPPIGIDSEITISAELAVRADHRRGDLGAARRCKACDEICPVNIEILDKILDMRRYLSLMESNFPAELGNAYRAMENQGNPWGMNQGERGDWAKGLDGVTVVDPGEPLSAEYLYWVGCAGSVRRQEQEGHPGDGQAAAPGRHRRRHPRARARCAPATRPAARGNEYLFQMLAMPNIEMLNGMGVKKIITQCPHCFNTLKNEYPQLGGNYEVIHHTPAARAADRQRPARRQPGNARGADHLPRLAATSAATTTCTSRRARWSARSRASRSSRCRATAPRACAAAPAGRACGWRSRSAPRSTTSGPREAISHRRHRGSPPPARSATSCSTTA